jgi:hypothetical protein
VVFLIFSNSFLQFAGIFSRVASDEWENKKQQQCRDGRFCFLNGQIHLPRGVDFQATLPSIRLRSPLRFAHAPLALDLICAERFILCKRLAHSDRLKSPLTAAAARDQVGGGFPLLVGHAQAESGQV